MKPKTESEHQIAVMAWAEEQAANGRPELSLLFHVPNGEKRNRVTAIKLKKMGVKPGVPDLFLPVSRGTFHGLWVEMKKPGGTVSTKQLEWVLGLQAQGYRVDVADGFEAARDTIEGYLCET
tara:strand:- start:9556 stop:9921 length:366 start_codon:yes stop_codon:yes gene_type:complete